MVANSPVERDLLISPIDDSTTLHLALTFHDLIPTFNLKRSLWRVGKIQ